MRSRHSGARPHGALVQSALDARVAIGAAGGPAARVVDNCAMASRADHPHSPFTAAERELIRREMGMHFGQHPSLADGLLLRTWRGGPHKGEPKLPPAVQSLLARGLVEVRTGRYGPRAFFTAAWLAALRQLLRDRRAMDPARFAHLRRELGLEAPEDTAE